MISRRSLLQTCSLAALSPSLQARHLQTVGVQLYTVRSLMPDKAAETLRALDAIGYREAEMVFADLDKILPAVQATRLKAVSIHLDSTLVTKGEDDAVRRTLDDLKRRGFTYAVMPYLPPAERGGLDVIHKLADRLNATAEKSRAAGLTFCYHNHAFEFEPMGNSSPMQVLLENTDKKLVQLEVDVFWVSVAGHDPVEFLTSLKGRVPLVHLKDKAQGTRTLYKESVERTAFKEVGNGTLDWPKILRAAQAAGTQHYFVEQDQTPGDPIESLRQSFTNISKLDY